jgi:signal transduction histidine kinase
VWVNLINNALQAMNYRGTMTLLCEEKDDKTRVSIVDSGTGIPDAILDQIFDPFFTTKERGHGLGIGLDICRKIVEGQGGRILVESHPGKTCFTVELPRGPA